MSAKPAAPPRRAPAEALLEALPDGVLDVGADGTVHRANPAAEELWGRSALRGLPLAGLGPAGRALEALLARGGAEARGFLTLAQGEVEVRAAPAGDGWAVVLRPPGPLAPLTADRPDLARITELAAGLAHEVRNPLSGIQGAAQLLAQEVGTGPLLAYAEVIAREAARVEGLVRGLLDLAGPRPARPRPVNLHALVDEVLLLAGTELPPGVTVHRRFDPSVPELPLDPEQLTQALLNLVQNAGEAMGAAGGILEVETGLALGLATVSGDRRRTMARLTVRDTGPGFPPEVLEKLYTPFFTTKARGTGLGLALSRRMVEGQGGLMSAGNATGGGAEVRLLLPVG